VRRGLRPVCCLIASSCGGSPGVALPLNGPEGCYVVLHEQRTSGPTFEFLFPAFFGLDSTPVPMAAQWQRVVLPTDDLARRAGSWSWRRMDDSVVIQVVADDQGWRLTLHADSAMWSGQLRGWAGDSAATWDAGGRRVSCPPGLVAAGSDGPG
jgi:hypothetical protein